MSTTSSKKIRPRIVIHGGAGNITRANIPPDNYKEYLSSLSAILCAVNPRLISGEYTALDAACAAVVLLENDPLFNAGKGAVFTLDGRNELEASVMVSRGSYKRGTGVFLLETVKNPILLAKELLRRDFDVEGGTKHNCISGKYAEGLAKEWGLDIVGTDYFWTKKRWDQHKRGLRPKPSPSLYDVDADSDDGEEVAVDPRVNVDGDDDEIDLDIEEYLPQGTVGCVALDSTGLLAVATSTGGLTNKLPGRIGDTPTLGAGFWAEEWTSKPKKNILDRLGLRKAREGKKRAVAISGTGEGDMFLRTCACHSIASRCKLAGDSLKHAAETVAGVGGEMDRIGKGGPDPHGGEAGVIGIDSEGEVVMAMNSGGMFRGTIDERGRVLVGAFRDEELQIRDPC